MSQSRREFLKQSLSLAGTGALALLASSCGNALFIKDIQQEAGDVQDLEELESQALRQRLFMPSEWEHHAGCLMAWSAAYGVYTRRQIGRIHREQATIAKAISTFEPVTMLARRQDVAKAKRWCGPNIKVIAMSVFDTWTRDTLPSFVHTKDGQLRAVGWNFNVWGEKFWGYRADRALARRVAHSFNIPFHRARIVCEGGAIEVDGQGNLLTTETCLLNRNRNPDMSKQEVERELRRLTGVRNVIWLWGSTVDTTTDGHIDGIARFIAPGVIVTEISDDPRDPEYEELRENARILERANDANGKAFEVIRLKRPRWDVIPWRGNNFAATYVNSYMANGGIVMPKFDDPQRDRAARDLFASLMPKRRIIQLRIDEITEGGGIHCITQHLPATV